MFLNTLQWHRTAPPQRINQPAMSLVPSMRNSALGHRDKTAKSFTVSTLLEHLFQGRKQTLYK